MAERVAETFRKGRLLLVGDAAGVDVATGRLPSTSCGSGGDVGTGEGRAVAPQGKR